MGNSTHYDPRLGRKFRYARLAMKLGGSIKEWKGEKESELQVFDKIIECLSRKERMANEEMKARMGQWK